MVVGQGLVGKGDRFFLADNQLTNCDAYPVAPPQHSCCFEYGMQIDLFLRKSHYDSDRQNRSSDLGPLTNSV